MRVRQTNCSIWDLCIFILAMPTWPYSNVKMASVVAVTFECGSQVGSNTSLSQATGAIFMIPVAITKLKEVL